MQVQLERFCTHLRTRILTFGTKSWEYCRRNVSTARLLNAHYSFRYEFVANFTGLEPLHISFNRFWVSNCIGSGRSHGIKA